MKHIPIFVIITVITVMLSACTTKLQTTTEIPQASPIMEAETVSQQEGDATIDNAPPLNTSDEPDDISADLNSTIIVEESFN